MSLYKDTVKERYTSLKWDMGTHTCSQFDEYEKILAKQ